jgi:FtsP/CotA-like multicopper oxidase with cupredoxin domain
VSEPEIRSCGGSLEGDLRQFLMLAGIVVLATFGTLGATAQDTTGTVRTYYIAADELDWDYMPKAGDGMGMAGSGYEKFFSQHGPRYIGRVYRKALYREYTDATFAHLKPRPPDEAYLGPVIHAAVGDTIEVVFHNHGTHTYSVHPHGVFYEKASEGSAYADGTPDPARCGNGVAPGKTCTYTWKATERSGPGPNDPSSIVWLYHSHVDERRDVNSGLIGAIVITRAGMATPDGRPKDVDREFVSLFMIYDENTSWFINDDVKRFVKDKKKFSPAQSMPFDPQGRFDPFVGTGFVPANFRATVNGYQFANGPTMQMALGQRVRWYVITLGEGANFHTPHWHGNTVLVGGQRTDVVNIGPASMVTADMLADDPGTWLLHCHVSDHMEAGMSARYRVSAR